MGEERFDTRYNVMRIDSVSAFMNIKGGMNQQCKDVYFTRIVGGSTGLGQEVEKMDMLLTGRMEEGKALYNRLDSLPKMARIEDGEYYAGCYANWTDSGRKRIIIKFTENNESLQSIVSDACAKVTQLFLREKNGNASSMEKNFVTKLLFWLDNAGLDRQPGWNPGYSMKFIVSNVSKIQEYLFCYLLTRIGIDVLLLQTEQDIDGELEKLALSHKVLLDTSCYCAIPTYEPMKYRDRGMDRRVAGMDSPERSKGAQGGICSIDCQGETQTSGSQGGTQSSGSQGGTQSSDCQGGTQPSRHVVNTRRPERDRQTARIQEAWRQEEQRQEEQRQEQQRQENRRQESQRQNPQTQTAWRQGTQQTVRPAAGSGSSVAAGRSAVIPAREEMQFEELALLASSVVMITIHDMTGKVIGSGSGIMIGAEGFILTNNHVACGGKYYSVRIEDDEQIYKTDEVIKYNSVLDLAVIRIDRRLQPLPLFSGRKKLVRGQKVVAIGSPLGLFNSVSNGIISGFRTIQGVDMIQFTAPISHGSSGGAVLNMYGEIIGISTAGIDDGQNINLAVGYESIRPFVNGFT